MSKRKYKKYLEPDSVSRIPVTTSQRLEKKAALEVRNQAVLLADQTCSDESSLEVGDPSKTNSACSYSCQAHTDISDALVQLDELPSYSEVSEPVRINSSTVDQTTVDKGQPHADTGEAPSHMSTSDLETTDSREVKMSDIDDESEIFFTVKFLGRIQVVRPGGMQILTDAVEALKDPNIEMGEKMKKAKVHLFLTRTAIDILEHKTKFMLYSCALPSVSFCAVHPSQPKILGFVAKHPAADMYHCYIFQSKKFSHLLVSIIGESFRTYKQNEGLQGDRDMVVEALRHKNKVLERENAELKRRLQANGESAGGVQNMHENESDIDKISSRSGQSSSQVRFFTEDDETPLQRNF